MKKPLESRSKRKGTKQEQRRTAPEASPPQSTPAAKITPASSSSFGRPSARWLRRLGAAFFGVLVVAAIVAGFASQPLEIAWRQWQARELLRHNNDVAAVRELRAALRRDLDNPETLFLLARAHRRLSDLDRVDALLRQAEAVGCDPARIQLEQRLMLAQTGQISEVESYLPEMLSDPGDDGPDICQAFVQGYLANLRNGNAQQLLDAWEKAYPDDPQPIFMRGYLSQSMGHPEQAIPLYREGLRRDPLRTGMRRMLAECLLQTDQLDDADREITLCAQQAPDDPQVRYVQAQCASGRSDLKQALRLLDETISLAPLHLDALRLRGQLQLTLGNVNEALADLQTVVQRQPYDTLAREALGRTLTALQRPEEAQPHLQYVAQAEPAVRELDRLIREAINRPQDPQLRFQIGSILFQYGSPADAAKWMRSVLELAPDSVGAHQALGAFYEASGDSAQAGYHRQRAAAAAAQRTPASD